MQIMEGDRILYKDITEKGLHMKCSVNKHQSLNILDLYLTRIADLPMKRSKVSLFIQLIQGPLFLMEDFGWYILNRDSQVEQRPKLY